MCYFYLLKQVPLYSDFALLRKTGEVSKILAPHTGGTNRGRSNKKTPKSTVQFIKLKRKSKKANLQHRAGYLAPSCFLFHRQ